MKLKQVVKAKVVEVMQDDSVIMSFQGRLVRVVNKSKANYKEGMIVSMLVTKIEPLEFKFIATK